MENNVSDLIPRDDLAFLWNIAEHTLATWDSQKRYDLKPVRRGRAVSYPRTTLEQFIGNRRLARLLTRKEAARDLRTTPKTLSSRKYNERHHLCPIKLGSRTVRYHPDDIQRSLEACMKPN